MSKVWQLTFEQKADKQFVKLSKNTQSRILDYFEDRVLVSDNPYSLASKLVGSAEDLWRFRVGDYRIICRIEQGCLIIAAVEVGHRKEIYKKTRN